MMIYWYGCGGAINFSSVLCSAGYGSFFILPDLREINVAGNLFFQIPKFCKRQKQLLANRLMDVWLMEKRVSTWRAVRSTLPIKDIL